MRRSAVVFLLTVYLAVSSLYSAVYTTAGSGFWQYGPAWTGGAAPAYTNSDTIIINHSIIFSGPLLLSGYLKINAGATLCGHYRLELYHGVMENYGALFCDTLHINQSDAWNHSGASMTIKMYALLIYDGSDLYVENGSSMWVGPDFNCGGSEVGIAEAREATVKLFPNPAQLNGAISILCDKVFFEDDFFISDVNGGTLLRFTTETSPAVIPLNGLAPGIYFLHHSKAAITPQKIIVAE